MVMNFETKYNICFRISEAGRYIFRVMVLGHFK